MATLEEILGSTLAAQVRLNPQPPDIRGHILAKFNKWVPVGEDVEQWLVKDRNATPPPPAQERRIEVECTESGTESGRASYTCSYTATGTISIPEDRLQQMIRNAGNRADAITAFEEWADDHQEADDYDRTNYDYDDEEATNNETDSRDHNARSVIEAYLDEHPELLEEEEEEVEEVATSPDDAEDLAAAREAGEYQHSEDNWEPEDDNS